MIKNDVRQKQNLTNTTKIDPNLRKIDKDRRYRNKRQKQTNSPKIGNQIYK